MALEISLRPKDLIAALTHCVEIRDPVFIWGPPGCGKSQIVAQIAKDLGYCFVDVRMSQIDAIDLRGMPMIPKGQTTQDTVMVWALPEFLPRDPEAKVIIFFDEMNHAIPANLSAAYQLIQERKLGSYVLPDNAVCMAAGNRKGDYGSDFELPAPLADRFTHLEMNVNAEDWIEWAINNQVNSTVIGFIAHRNEYLQQYDQLGKNMVFATPRSWAKVHDHMNESLPDNLMLALIAGRVSKPLAIEFMAYREQAAYLPDPVEVLLGNVTELKSTKVDVLYSLSMSLCYKLHDFHVAMGAGELDSKEYDALANNFLKFISENFPKIDLVIMTIKTAIVTNKVRLDTSLPYFEEFLKKYGREIAKYIR